MKKNKDVEEVLSMAKEMQLLSKADFYEMKGIVKGLLISAKSKKRPEIVNENSFSSSSSNMF